MAMRNVNLAPMGRNVGYKGKKRVQSFDDLSASTKIAVKMANIANESENNTERAIGLIENSFNDALGKAKARPTNSNRPRR